MSNEDIVRAWKDAEYRQGLSAQEQALLPEHPAGAIKLTKDEMNQVAGGYIVTSSFEPDCPSTKPLAICTISYCQITG